MSFSLVLFDDCSSRERLRPLTTTRPTGNLRVGIWTLDQKWHHAFDADVAYLTQDYLREKFPMPPMDSEGYLIIDGRVLPNAELVDEIWGLQLNQKLISDDGDWIALKLATLDDFNVPALERAVAVLSHSRINRLHYPEDIYLNNADQIRFDLDCMGIQAVGADGYPDSHFLGTSIYIDKNAVLKHCILDATQGPIYIGEGVVIEAGAVIHGPAAIGAGCRVKSGTVVYSNVSVGVNCTICGELNNTVIWGNSAKGHLGYLGCAVVGEGCNIGAGTNNSNLRNDWKTVRLYDYSQAGMRDTGLQKCGVIIGDHVMLGIGCKINTGTVIGVGAQIAISNFIPKFVPDFGWLTDLTQDRYIFAAFIAMLQRKALVKGECFGHEEEKILSLVYEESRNV
ncbi:MULTISPECIES: putative sugar nucleotidyl transferase [Sphingobacterium]|uniref:putative sugar nucleotidyl transferase n=1 Tax=Sphingobacterium TaxID=28453 RepID=UPI0013DC84E0|nr:MULTISPECIES: putative sugar nucleotidyl transferase [unclassified Sphingobacterium]